MKTIAETVKDNEPWSKAIIAALEARERERDETERERVKAAFRAEWHDDGEPVTAEWLRATIGWIPVEKDGYIGADKIIFCKGSEDVYSAWLQISEYYYDMRRIVRVKTRGDVRLLCRALGVALKEGER